MSRPQTRQATMDWESQDDGYVAALLVEDGAKDLAVGSPVLVFVEDQARRLGSPMLPRAFCG
jgi:pyruvate dehydrogenase E2 component (dihydrolipoamide acetyltransferase)